MSDTTELRAARELLEWDWLECRGMRGRRASTLHFPTLDDFGLHLQQIDDECRIGGFLAVCGRPFASGHIPGVFTRMGAMRCSQCCDALGYPHGKGSPKNDPSARPLVEARLAKAAAR